VSGRVALALAPLLLLVTPPLAAQAVIMGTVREDTTGRPLADVEVVIEALGRRVFTDSAGRYALSGIQPGARLMLVRRVGYLAVGIMVQLGPNDTIRRDVSLEPLAVELDPIEVTGRPETRRPRGIGVEAFEERRRMGFGRFIDSTMLRQNEYRRLSELLQRAGVEVAPRGASRQWAVGRSGCRLRVYLDGVPIADPPDVNSFSPVGLEAVEAYRSPADVPLEYGGLDARCGVLLLWTRQYR
jgi:hypothetical protein